MTGDIIGGGDALRRRGESLGADIRELAEWLSSPRSELRHGADAGLTAVQQALHWVQTTTTWVYVEPSQ